MADAQQETAHETAYLSEINDTDIHVDLIRQKSLVVATSVPRESILAAQTPINTFPEWYLKARKIDRDHWRDLFGLRWLFQGYVDELTADLQGIKAFAEPLLLKALKDQLNVELDVRVAELRLYVPSKIIFGISRGADHLRKMTLLDAALHNFEAAEAQADAFSEGSGVFTADEQGAPQRHSMTVAQFVTLARTLDLGAKYQAHIKGVLQPVAATQRVKLQQETVARDKQVFKLAALTAVLKGEITNHGYGALLKVADGEAHRTFYDLPLHNHRLSLMGFRLHGITLFSAVGEPGWAQKAVNSLTSTALRTVLDWAQMVPFLPHQDFERLKLLKAFFANGPKGLSEAMARDQDNYRQSRLIGHVIVYIPDDPEHPLREYDSFSDFMKTLIGQLRTSGYQEFFSRFVAQQDQGAFFRRVNERLKTFTWKQREPLDMGPWWRETAIERPDPEPITNVITDNLWSTLYHERRDKAIADARRIAVPTGDEDAQSRWTRLSGYLDIAWNLFNFTAMLVPGLGEAMLAIMVAQLAEDLAEGIEDWSKGDRDEASAHICSVLINGAQLAMMGAGHVLPGGIPVAVTPSPVVDSLKAVQLPDGTPSLWKPDLAPYERALPLPENSQPDAQGLHDHDGTSVLALENKRYAVKKDPATARPRIQHPVRENAYQPTLAQNDLGGWITELEEPLAWDEDKVWSRLGHSLENLAPERQAQVRTVSGVDHNQLRRMHAEHERAPGILADTIKRFQVYAEVEGLSQQILHNTVTQSLEGFLPTFLCELPFWPESRAIELFETDAASGVYSGASIKYGNANATGTQVIKVSRAQLRGGKLAERVLAALSEDEIHALIGQRVSSMRGERLQALSDRLAMRAGGEIERVFESMYQRGELIEDPRQLLLQRDFAQLPHSVARQLIEQASREELRFIEQKSRLPLRLRTQAREALREVRIARSYEGLYLDAVAGADTERLALHSVAALPGWADNVRIEVRELGFEGTLRDSVGPQSAAIRKVLVVNENGLFEARDDLDLHLHGADDLYAALLHALPDKERTALGFDIFQGAQLKRKVQQQPLARGTFSTVLQDAPINQPAYDPHTMKLPGGMPRDFQRITPGEANARMRLNSLYPGFVSDDIDRVLDNLYRRNIPLDAYVRSIEHEFSNLCETLQRWRDSPTDAIRFSPAGVAQWHARNELCTLLRRCWQRTGPKGVRAAGLAHPQSLVLDGMPLDRHLVNFPQLQADFDHVTSLSLRNTGVSSGQLRFVQNFRRLRVLDMTDNLLTELPPFIGDMRYLTDLALNGNRIVLTPEAVARLRSLDRMHAMAFSGNPIGLVPDITLMRDLHVLVLEDTGIDTWPTGIFSQQRPRNIYLDMRNNPITQVPQVAPGSFRAELLGRTHLSLSEPPMSAEAIRQVRLYTESVGLDPERAYPPLGTVDSVQWTQGMTTAQWRSQQVIWDELEDEFGSEAFFSLLKDLTETADFKSGGVYRGDLSDKVWRMLKAMHENGELRESLFAEATVPTNCRDGAIQAFNELGMRVLVDEAKSLGNPGLVEGELVELAKGQSRIEQVNAIARRHVAERLAAKEQLRRVDAEGNVVGTIDVVEVHLSFLIGLADRLDLPWQARSMLFRNMAGVTQKMIDDAYDTVIALEQAPLLRESIIAVPFWKDYVEASNRRAFRALRKRYDDVTALKIALDERASGQALTPAAKAKLKEELRILAFELGKPDSAIAPGVVMSDAACNAELADIEAQINQLRQTLTQQAMDRAKVQRVEIPFKVETTTD